MVRESDSVLFQGFSSKKYDEGEDETSSKKKRLILVAAGACSLLLPLILMISFGHHGTKAAVKQTVQPVAAATDTQPVTTTPDQQVSESLPQDKPQAATPKQQTTDSQPVLKEEAANSTQPASELQTQMMNDQLTAPRMISGDMKKQGLENAPPPPSLGAGAADGLGGGSTMASVFSGHNQPTVKAARPITISSGVATGMLIQKAPPIYPTIAKAARVSGTVELQATISKAGTIKDLHIVSGPAMLRQSALDAVRTWRYKPYKLNNDPVEVETTVNVVFTLGN
jgi:TonB family protein